MQTDDTKDEMGAALDSAEQVQRRALVAARACVMQALAALKPFEAHEGRILQGIERPVKEERERLTKAASALDAIVALHLAGPEKAAAVLRLHEADEGAA